MSGQVIQTIESLISEISQDPIIREGLKAPYSPNHGSQTTTEHIIKQLEMVRLLCVEDYDGLHSMVENEKLPENLRITPSDLRLVLNGPRDTLSPEDWRTLTVLAGYHDVGKVRQDWAKEQGWRFPGVDWIAHDFDGKQILGNNPAFLARYDLSAEQTALVLELTKLHSLPGQYFFGEGNIVAYESVGNHLHIARIHGLLDVMSAINHRMVKPIVDSHARLGNLLDHYRPDSFPTESTETRLHQLFLADAREQLENDIPIGPIAWHRLRLLMGKACTPIHLLMALDQLDPSFVTEFDRITDGKTTWYGTYVANAFGQGLVKALEPSNEQKIKAVQLLVKVVSAASAAVESDSSWALSSLDPSLQVAKGRPEALVVLRALDGLDSLEETKEALRARRRSLSMRVASSGVEISTIDE